MLARNRYIYICYLILAHSIPDDGFLDLKRRFLYILLCNMINYALCVLFLSKFLILLNMHYLIFSIQPAVTVVY